jgi:exodeoxyribonuclease VII large subunit
MALETSAEAPVPVRTVLQAVSGWIGKLGRIWVEGQIAECKKRGNTVFLTLRDPIAAVSAQVICTRQVFEVVSPVEGARVVMFVRPDFNATRGSFALTALEIRAVGVGELLARLEKLRVELTAEGLFSAERKRALPFLPGVIGLVCGRDSAAERDVVQNAQRRWPAVRFRIEQSAVQGPYAAGEVIEALRKLDADPEVEVIVIARGGGSLEDLLAFSDEALLRAVAACRTPVVSAIGHEQDTPSWRSSPSCATGRGGACGAGSTASRPGWTRPAPARPSPTPSARSSGRPSRSTRSSGGPASRSTQAWPERATTSRTPAPGCSRSPPPPPSAVVTQSPKTPRGR